MLSMLLSKETTIKVNSTQSNIINHLGYAASKLWNVCNYERKHYDSTAGQSYPDWYKQKASHKDDIWFKSLPSQTAQEVCKLLHKSWKSYYKLLKTGGIKNPHPPRYKQEPITVTYMQNGIKRIDSKTLQLTLTKALKKHMSERYDIHEDNLIIKNRIFGDMEKIKQIKLYMPEDNVIRVIVVYEIADVKKLEDNGHYLSIDLGIHNLMTCYDSEGSSFIIGRNYLSIARWHDKEIARVQSQWEQQQSKKGIKYPKPSQHVLDLYKDKRHKIKDYIHKVTRWIADYCKTNRINTVIIGDLTGIREDNDKGDRINQELHALPYKIITDILEYKLGLFGISMKRVKECYSSQCSPNCSIVQKVSATPEKRINRGLYQDGHAVWIADSVGAYNIMRLYFQQEGIIRTLNQKGLSNTTIIKVAA